MIDQDKTPVIFPQDEKLSSLSLAQLVEHATVEVESNT
jgi:hypothetical protein